jgi:hypothetical protein
LPGKGNVAPEIGRLAGRATGTVGDWVKKYGLTAYGASRFAPGSGISEEALEDAIFEGRTVDEIAIELDCSISTVRYWLKKYGFPTATALPRRSTRFADPVGTRKQVTCRHHGETEFVVEGRRYYQCLRYRSEAVAKPDERSSGSWLKTPATSRSISPFAAATSGIDKLRAEDRKCVLLCATCHTEVEAGDAELPLKFDRCSGRSEVTTVD